MIKENSKPYLNPALIAAMKVISASGDYVWTARKFVVRMLKLEIYGYN